MGLPARASHPFRVFSRVSRAPFLRQKRGQLTLGETVVDWDEVTQRPANALWINEVDPNGFYSLMTETIAQLP